MLMFFLATIATAAQDKGLLGLGSLCAAGLGLVGWLDRRMRNMDERVRLAEIDTATNTATIIQIDKNVRWLRAQRENGHARD